MDFKIFYLFIFPNFLLKQIPTVYKISQYSHTNWSIRRPAPKSPDHRPIKHEHDNFFSQIRLKLIRIHTYTHPDTELMRRALR